MIKNFDIKGYFKPTPKRFRVLGDTLLSISVFASSYAILNDSKYFAISTMITGCIGKFFTNFFVDEEPEKPLE